MTQIIPKVDQENSFAVTKNISVLEMDDEQSHKRRTEMRQLFQNDDIIWKYQYYRYDSQYARS